MHPLFLNKAVDFFQNTVCDCRTFGKPPHFFKRMVSFRWSLSFGKATVISDMEHRQEIKRFSKPLIFMLLITVAHTRKS